jgi:hypothetical protein
MMLAEILFVFRSHIILMRPPDSAPGRKSVAATAKEITTKMLLMDYRRVIG